MPQNASQLEIPLEPLTNNAFDAFCEDVASMFGNAAECSADRAGQGNLADLKKEFKKIASVNHVQALGALQGTFHLLLDQAGLFVLAGIFVMLPEKRIHETIRSGTLKDADYINDAIKEVGNLLVGSWDRIFREQMDGHKHFKQTGTFVGSLWDDTQTSFGLETEQPCHYVICNMKVDDFPDFKCAAVFSDDLFGPHDEPAQTEPSETAPAEAVALPETTDEKTSPDAAESAPADAVTETVADEAAALPESAPEAVETADENTPPVAAEPVQEDPVSDTAPPGPVAEAIRELTRTDALPSIPAAAVQPHAAWTALTAGQIMHQAVLWADPDDTVEEVLRRMQQHNVGYVLAGREGHIEGILSHSDIAAAVSPYTRAVFAQWRRPLDDASLQIRIKWFMSRPVHTIRPETPLISIMDTMMRHSVRGLPVVDAAGQTMGLVTVYTIFQSLLGCAGVSVTGQPQQNRPSSVGS